MTDIYGGIDPRNVPAYSIGDAARYLRIPQATIRSWTLGRKYQTTRGISDFHPLIVVKNAKPRLLLSFTNLVEVHILRAIRQQHRIELDKVRIALDFIEEEFQVSHPLAYERFRTDGVNLFLERYGSLIEVSSQDKIELKDAFNTHLERIEPDDSGLAIKLYPFTQSSEEDSPRLVVINPRIAFGQLVIAGTGITTRILAERFRAGDSIEYLAQDYNCDRLKIEAAIRCELSAA